MPPKGTTEKLMKDSVDAPEVLKRCLHRLEWDRTQQRIKQEEEDRLEEERQAMGSIDWHDFVVAETIEFDAGEEEGLPEPLAPRDLVAAVKREIYGEEELEEEEEAVRACSTLLRCPSEIPPARTESGGGGGVGFGGCRRVRCPRRCRRRTRR